MQEVLKVWLASKPLTNRNAPPHPMVTAGYKALMKSEGAEAEELRKKAHDYWPAAQLANYYSDRYNLFTVIFSMIMFLGAIITKMTHVRLSFTLIIMSGFICVVILAILFFSMPLAKE